jgi:predicted HAD superfamily phosphohydrolase
MIYIGDGLTDIPCMKLVKERGGKSIAVYPRGNSEHVKPLVEDARINYVCMADYTEGSPLEQIVMLMIEKMAILEKLREQEVEQLSRYKQFFGQDS